MAPGVAEDDDMAFSGDRCQLVKGGKHEHGSLSHAGFGLTDDIHTEERLRDALVLHCLIGNLSEVPFSTFFYKYTAGVATWWFVIMVIAKNALQIL